MNENEKNMQGTEAETAVTAETPKETTEAATEATETLAGDPAAHYNRLLDYLGEYGIGKITAQQAVSQLGIRNVEDLELLTVEDLVSGGLKLVQARRLYAASHPEPTKEETAAKEAVAAERTAMDTRALQDQLLALLPVVPSDESWMKDLKAGGVLKVEESTYIAAIRAALADKAGLYDVPRALVSEMERFTDECEEPAGPSFFPLRKQLLRRDHGDIFEAIDGLDGSYITDARRKKFLGDVQTNLWPAIAESFQTLDGWYQAYRASFGDPSMLLIALNGGLSGMGGASMMPPPDTGALHDAGDTLVNAINRTFRGTGVQLAAALAYEANTIRQTLENPQLPGMIGVKNRELMLKKIHANVSSNYVRLEQNLVKYVLGFVKHDQITSDVEVNYFGALWQLGSQINWKELSGETTSSVLRSVTGRQL